MLRSSKEVSKVGAAKRKRCCWKFNSTLEDDKHPHTQTHTKCGARRVPASPLVRRSFNTYMLACMPQCHATIHVLADNTLGHQPAIPPSQRQQAWTPPAHSGARALLSLRSHTGSTHFVDDLPPCKCGCSGFTLARTWQPKIKQHSHDNRRLKSKQAHATGTWLVSG